MEQVYSLLLIQQSQLDELVKLVLLQGELLNKLCEPLSRHEKLCQELVHVQRKILKRSEENCKT
jgi:hypothetical protein